MSNRVYLFSTNFVPGTDVEDRRVVGISEWGYDIPIGFKILASASPRKCPSLIFEETFAVIADYEKGAARFLEFLARIPHPTVPDLAEGAHEFLTAENNKNRHFLLEPEEYFWLGANQPGTQMEHLLAELADLDPLMEKAIAELDARMYEEDHPPGFFARLFGARSPVRKNDSTDMVNALGLGYWSNTLFFDPK